MTAIDRDYVQGLVSEARDVQENRAQLFAEKHATGLTLQAENRSYTVALLIDAIDNGLLEQLHDEAEQRLYIDVAVDQDRAWAAYLAGMASPPETTAPPAVPVGTPLRPADDGDDDEPLAPWEQELLDNSVGPGAVVFAPGDSVNIADGTGAVFDKPDRHPGNPIEGLYGKVVAVSDGLVTIAYDNLGSTLSLPPTQIMHHADWITVDDDEPFDDCGATR